jgi:oxygen-independent coproporphyrinogen-3 oxidase
MDRGLSIYVHIPYCLQRCRYCDFTTFEQSEILPPQNYVDWVLREIRNRRHLWQQAEARTLYFGGGTPSLIAPELIVAICQELAKVGFEFTTSSERTIEINPATLTEEKLNIYLEAGINRFSVGAQTFDDALLKMCGRKHDAADTRETLRLLQKYKLNYSFDLLFALPGQTLGQVNRDLDEVLDFDPPHLSAYCLTVPETHPMAKGRAPENDQVAMFDLIEARLKTIGHYKYEISNFSRPGFESLHNMAYWSDTDYWGLGLSSHSYKREGNGLRFWNPKVPDDYGRQTAIEGAKFTEILPSAQFEKLQVHESLTDFNHMFLRTARGLSEEALRNKFPEAILANLWPRIRRLEERGLLRGSEGRWTLTERGQLISNKVFEELTFLERDLAQVALTLA